MIPYPMKRMPMLLAFSLLAAPLPAQDVWPLERCIQYALEHNTGLREQHLEVELRDAELQRSRFDVLPSLHAGIGQDWNWGRSVDMQELVIVRNRLTRATAASLGASLTIFDGLSKHYGRLAAGKAAEAARQDARRMESELEIDITRAYLQLMLAKQFHAYTQESHQTILQQRERTATLVEAGSQPKSALHEIEAQVASEKAAMVEAACRVRTETLALARLMNLPASEPFVTSDVFGQEPVVEKVPVITDQQIEDYLRIDPRILRSGASLEEMHQRKNQARASYFPTLHLSAGYGSYYSSSADEPFWKQMDENRNPSLSLQLDIPIFQALQTTIQVRKSRLAQDLARLDLEKVRTQITDEIRSATIEAENCCQKYLSSEETLRAMKSLLEVTEAKYNLGAATALDYVVARNNHFKAVSDYLQAKWQFLFQLKLLERYRQ